MRFRFERFGSYLEKKDPKLLHFIFKVRNYYHITTKNNKLDKSFNRKKKWGSV